MKIKFILFVFCFCILSSAFPQKILSLNSLFTEQDAVLVPEIEGLWVIPDFDITVSINKVGDNFHLLKYVVKKMHPLLKQHLQKSRTKYFLTSAE